MKIIDFFNKGSMGIFNIILKEFFYWIIKTIFFCIDFYYFS